MRLLGRILVSLPGPLLVVAAAIATGILGLLVAIYGAVLGLVFLVIGLAVNLLARLVSLPILPIRYAIVRWAYGHSPRDLLKDASMGFVLTMTFRAVGRLPRAVGRSYSDALIDSYRQVPSRYRVLYLRLPGSGWVSKSWTPKLMAFVVLVVLVVLAMVAAWDLPLWSELRSIRWPSV